MNNKLVLESESQESPYPLYRSDHHGYRQTRCISATPARPDRINFNTWCIRLCPGAEWPSEFGGCSRDYTSDFCCNPFKELKNQNCNKNPLCVCRKNTYSFRRDYEQFEIAQTVSHFSHIICDNCQYG